MPVLAAVRLESDGTTLQLITTDRYVLATDTVAAVEPGEPFTFTLAGDDAVKIAGMCKGAPKNVQYWPIRFGVSDDRLTVATYDQTVTCAPVDGEFPRWRSIFTGAQESGTDDTRGAAHIAYNPQLLAKFAKVTVNGRKANTVKLHFTAPAKTSAAWTTRPQASGTAAWVAVTT
jgi:DNA polymerase III sliding clamp (beta) subunit (PCNA family)